MKLSGGIKSIVDAIDSKSPSLGTFQREKGKGFTRGYIALWLMYLNNILNLNKPMTEQQIELASVKIAEEFYMLKVSDITFLFNKIIGGEYGEFYESLSIAKLLTFFRNYLEERFEQATDRSLRKHKDLKSMEEFNMTSNIERIYKRQSKGFNKK